MCFISVNQHKEHNIINFADLYQKQEQKKNKNIELIESIQKAKKLVNIIIDSLDKFKENLDI